MRCPRMHKPVVVGRTVESKIILVGQAPGDKEPIMGRPLLGQQVKLYSNGLMKGWVGLKIKPVTEFISLPYVAAFQVKKRKVEIGFQVLMKLQNVLIG